MANVTITQLPAVSTPTNAGAIPLVVSNVTSQIAAANLRAYVLSGDVANIGNISSTGTITAAGNITAPYFVGNATSATTAGTVTTAAQGNITSVGTLTSLTVSGNLTANNAAINSRLLLANGNVSTPSLAFSSDGLIDTGLYWIGDGNIGIATNGQATASFNSAGLNVNANITTTNLDVTGEATISDWAEVPQLWFKGALTSNQTLTANVDTTINYTSNSDPLGWGATAGTNGRIVPNKAGWYEITSRLEFSSGSGNTDAQINHQILVGGNSVAISQVPNIVVAGSGMAVVTTAWVNLNGTTDYITTSCYTTLTGQQAVGGNSSLLTIKWIST